MFSILAEVRERVLKFVKFICLPRLVVKSVREPTVQMNGPIDDAATPVVGDL